jgi:serine/threonine protein kinase/Flp pilus assembly protein TadD
MHFPSSLAFSASHPPSLSSSEAIRGAGTVDSWVDLPVAAAVPDLADVPATQPEDSWTDLPTFRFPEVDGDFLGFHLVGELGRGAFGRVYLARQDDLAGRLVALKISTEDKTEPHILARLQHTHIVPVYSVHRAGSLQAVCMPYFGSATLADALRDLTRRQVPPASGKALVSTIQDRAGRTNLLARSASKGNGSASKSPQARSASEGSSAPLACASGSWPVSPSALLAESVTTSTEAKPPEEAAPTLRMLEGLSHVDAVLWMGERLADGLAHAHERGILHRDLKPANVLLTDDGQPMLLDFNLSADTQASASRARIGGTLPYMAPEHLAFFGSLPAPFPPRGNTPAAADARSDIYALGVILYELLTGQPPFEQPRENGPDLIPRMIAARSGPPPRLRTINRGVSPAIESIIRHCLEPDPARRYQSARHLAEDLQRQRCDQPLAYAREVSIRERSAKWLRRNRRRAVLTAGAFAALVVVALVGGLASHRQRLDRMEAAASWSAFREEIDEAHMLFAANPRHVEQHRKGLRITHQALARYDVLGQPAWASQPAVERLPQHERQRLRQAVGKLVLLSAYVEKDPEQKALLIERATDCFAPDEAPRALFLQRAEEARRRGDRDEAEACRDKARLCPIHSATDHYLLARDCLDRGQFVQTVVHLQETLRLDPKHFAASYLLGNCCMDGAAGIMPDDNEAVRCFSVCIALRPDFYGAYFNRGIVQERKGKLAEAEVDFTVVLQMWPDFADAHLHRGLVRASQGKLKEALADLSRAIEIGNVASRTWFARAEVRKKLGDKSGAARDEKDGLRHPPRDEQSHIRRGVIRLPSDPRGALADFQAAVRLNPRSLPGLYNQALVFADRLGQTKEALAALDEAIRQHPHRPEPLVSRGVLRARIGQHKAAHADGAAARKLVPNSPQILYQVACIHAHTSRARPEDRDEAFRLLTLALKGGFGHQLMETDPDLAPLRKDRRFRELREAVRLLTTW